MLKKKSAEEQSIVDNLIAANKHLTTLDPDTDEYSKTLGHIQTLSCILTDMREKKIGVEPWIPVIGHIGGIGFIAVVEAFGHVITSKAMSLTSPFRMKK